MKSNLMDMYIKNLENSYDAMGKIAMDNIMEEVAVKVGGHKVANRGDRRRATALNKKRMKNLSAYSLVEIRSTGKVKNYGEKHYFKGSKAWTKKVRHEKWYEPMPEEVQTTGVTIDDDDFVWQSATIGEPIAPKVYDAWYWYKYDVTMEAWEELVNIKKSIINVLELNKILHSDKLADIIENLADNWSEEF